MLIRHCDICRKDIGTGMNDNSRFYNATIAEEINMGEFYTKYKNPSNTVVYMDICPSCYTEIKEFIKERKRV